MTIGAGWADGAWVDAGWVSGAWEQDAGAVTPVYGWGARGRIGKHTAIDTHKRIGTDTAIDTHKTIGSSTA